MIVKSLHVENLLTFDTFDLDLGDRTHTIVGPNGAGKSNIIRVFDLVGEAVDWACQGARAPQFIETAKQVLESFAAARHHGSAPDRPALVRLALEFTTPGERELLTTFLRAAILCNLLDETNRDPKIARKLSEWVISEITDDAIAPLFVGTIVLHHAGMPRLSWEVTYEFEYDGCTYGWLMATRGFSYSIVRMGDEATRPINVVHKQLKECLLGLPQSSPQPVELPDPLPAFAFSSLCPGENESLTPINVRTGTGSFDVALPPCRRASELLGIPAVSMGQQAFPLAHVLAMLLDGGIITMGEQFRGLGVGGTPPQQAGPYSWEALVSPVRSRAPWALPLRLFELKNGNPDERATFRCIQETFTDLAPGRSFDVKFQAVDLEAMNPSTIGTGQLALYPPAMTEVPQPPLPRPGAVVSIVVDRIADDGLHPNDLPIQLHGAGTWEMLVLAEALVGAEGRFVVLDEPALTLHPPWQRALRSHIQNALGTFLVVTHSADLVPMDSASQLHQLVRIENEGGASPADLDLAFYSVGGDTNFRTLVTVLHALTIPWVLVCDGAAFDVRTRNKSHPHIFKQVLEARVQIKELDDYLAQLDSDVSKRVMDKTVFDKDTQLARTHGVFTLAEGWITRTKGTRPGTPPDDESFEAFLERVAPGKLSDAEDAVGDSKVRMGLWIAENVPCPAEVGDLYQRIITVLRQRGLGS